MLNQSGDPRQMKRIVDTGKSVSDVSEKVSVDRARTVPDTFQNAADKLYPAWVNLLKSAAIKPTIRPARKLISEQLCSQRKAETITPAQIDIVINGWIDRALSEGIIRKKIRRAVSVSLNIYCLVTIQNWAHRKSNWPCL